MIVNELIAQLAQLPGDMGIEVFHHVYNGGGDEDSFDKPVIRIDESLRVAYIMPDYLADMLSWAYSIDDLIK